MAKTNKILPYIIIGIPVLIGGFFLYKYIKGNRKGQDAPPNYNKSDDGNTESSQDSKGQTSTKSASSKYFPLRKGSKGAKVKELQEAILMYDSTLLPKYGADSDFGSETQNALNKILGKSTADSQADIDSIVQKANDLKKNEETKKANETATQNRIALAKKLIDLKVNATVWKRFYPLYDKITLNKYQLTSDGRELSRGTASLSSGKGIAWTMDGKTTFKVNSKGNILAYEPNGDVWEFNPYGFEVK